MLYNIRVVQSPYSATAAVGWIVGTGFRMKRINIKRMIRQESGGEPHNSYSHEARKVRNVCVACDLHKLISVPNPLEDHDASIPNNTARNEIAVTTGVLRSNIEQD